MHQIFDFFFLARIVDRYSRIQVLRDIIPIRNMVDRVEIKIPLDQHPIKRCFRISYTNVRVGGSRPGDTVEKNLASRTIVVVIELRF